MTKNELIYQPHFTHWMLEKLCKNTGMSAEAIEAMYKLGREEMAITDVPLKPYQVDTLQEIKWVKQAYAKANN